MTLEMSGQQPTPLAASKAFLGRRAAARLIDGWLMFVVLVFSWGIPYLAVAGDCDLQSPSCHHEGAAYLTIVYVVGTASFLFGVAFPFLYEFLSIVRWQKTIGKAAVGLRVVQESGANPRWWQCLLRLVLVWATLLGPGAVIFDVQATPGSHYGWSLFALTLSCVGIAGALAFAAFTRTFLHDRLTGLRVVPT